MTSNQITAKSFTCECRERREKSESDNIVDVVETKNRVRVIQQTQRKRTGGSSNSDMSGLEERGQ